MRTVLNGINISGNKTHAEKTINYIEREYGAESLKQTIWEMRVEINLLSQLLYGAREDAKMQRNSNQRWWGEFLRIDI